MKCLSSLAIILVFLTACNNNKPKTEVTIPSGDGNGTVKIDVEKTKDALQTLKNRKEELEQMTPLTKDEFIAMLPGELMGGIRTDIDVNEQMGAIAAEADYKIDDSTKLKVEIVDCAGPGGAGLFQFRYVNAMQMESETDEETLKTTQVDGNNAYITCKKKKARCTLFYFSGNRYLVNLRGDNISSDQLMGVANGLKLK